MTEGIIKDLLGKEIITAFAQVNDFIYTVTSPEFLLAQIGWISKVFLIGLMAYMGSLLIWRLLKRWVSQMSGDMKFRYALLNAANGPLGAFIWIFALGVMARVLQTRFGVHSSISFFLEIKPALHIAIIAWFFLRLNRMVFRDFLTTRQNVSAAVRDLGQKMGTAVILLIFALSVLPFFGVSVSGLLTVGGVGGLVIGFASKDAIANYIGAIMLHFDQPFKVGDWVRLPDKNVEGIVESIGWRQVVIRDFNKQPAYVPNAMFGTIIVENPGRMTFRRMKFYLSLRQSDLPLMQSLTDKIQNFLNNKPEFEKSEGIVVAFEKMTPISLDIQISAYTKIIDNFEFLKLQQNCLVGIGELVNAQGAKLANPIQTMDSLAQG